MTSHRLDNSPWILREHETANEPYIRTADGPYIETVDEPYIQTAKRPYFETTDEPHIQTAKAEGRYDNRRKKTFCGLYLRTVIILGLAALVVVGAILGAVLGTRLSRKTDTLAIISAIYAATNVTVQAQANSQKGPDIVVNTINLNTLWTNSSDPWPGMSKCGAILLSDSASTQISTFVACENTGSYTLAPGNISMSANTKQIPRLPPDGGSFALVSVVWGPEEIRDEDTYQTLYQYKLNGTAVPFENFVFGRDTWEGHYKSGVVWYTEDGFETIKSIFAREGGSAEF